MMLFPANAATLGEINYLQIWRDRIRRIMAKRLNS
jgi:hypothetical protein